MKKISLLAMVLFCGTIAWSKENGIPLIGEKAPSFTANTTNGTINFPEDFGKSWKILFSHPKDFTPVCTSEVLQLARMQDEFEALNVKVAVISTDVLSQHVMWKKSIEEIKQNDKNSVAIKFPLIDDSKIVVSKLYGMIQEASSTTKDVRGVFIIDPDNNIQAINFYPMKVGRNMDEIKRIVEALQTVTESKVLTPANWKPGDDVLLPFSPYPNKELEANADLMKLFYNVGPVMWYKKNQ